MSGAVRSAGTLGDGASSDGVGLFVAVVVLAGVLARVLVAVEVLVCADVLVSVGTAVFLVAFGLPDSDFASASGDVVSVRESAFFSADSLAADFDLSACSSSVAPDFLRSAFLPSDEDESFFSFSACLLSAFVSLFLSFLSLLSSDRSDLPSDRSDFSSDLPPDDFSDPPPPSAEPLSFPATAATRSPTALAGAVLARAVAASSAAARRKPHIRAASTRTRRVAERSRARHVPSMPVTPLRRRTHLVEWRIAADRARQSLSGVEIDKLLRTVAGVSFQAGGTTTKRTP